MRQCPDDIYARFARIWADSLPVVESEALQAAIDAHGLKPESVSDQWLRSLNGDWVYNRSERPFGDEELNDRYHRIMST